MIFQSGTQFWYYNCCSKLGVNLVERRSKQFEHFQVPCFTASHSRRNYAFFPFVLPMLNEHHPSDNIFSYPHPTVENQQCEMHDTERIVILLSAGGYQNIWHGIFSLCIRIECLRFDFNILFEAFKTSHF